MSASKTLVALNPAEASLAHVEVHYDWPESELPKLLSCPDPTWLFPWRATTVHDKQSVNAPASTVSHLVLTTGDYRLVLSRRDKSSMILITQCGDALGTRPNG